MALKLNRPVVQESQEPATNAETARFISGASRKPVTSKARLLNFRLSESFDDILEAEALRTGQSRTTILKAALAAYDNMEESQKTYWIMESAKM
ncbi:ribbon-helix-helix protein, CopG family [Pantoea agglomerans]